MPGKECGILVSSLPLCFLEGKVGSLLCHVPLPQCVDSPETQRKGTIQSLTSKSVSENRSSSFYDNCLRNSIRVREG